MRQKRQNHKKSATFFSRHHHIKHILIGVAVVFGVLFGLLIYSKVRVGLQQAKLAPFYDTTGLPTNGPLGEVVRQEPLGVVVAGGSAYRILYRTQKFDGTNTFSSARLFIPDNNSGGNPRPVVAWAHGTLGLGDQCAPSRAANPVANFDWVSDMLQKGWVVTATDYAGFGTAGTQGYLVGDDEAHDVLNSVRAAQNFPGSGASANFAVWGHSQGGHSALFTASQASAYAPELKLVSTVASAPAAELPTLFSEQYNTVIDWVIGPLVGVAWPAVNSSLNVDDIMTTAGKNNYQRMAQQCIPVTTLGGLTRTALKQSFFKTNVVDVPAWMAMAQQQTAPTLSADKPLLVVESTSDQVVLPDTTALYIKNACQAGSNLTSLWVGDVGHMQIPNVTAPDVITWLSDRFSGKPTSPSCANTLPVSPST